MPAPLAGYVRVSFVGGRGGDSFHSPDDQVQEIQSWARGRGLVVEMLAPELDGKGSDATRPIFRQAIDGVKAGRYSGVVVAYLSRAGRDLRLMLDLWDEVEAAGGVVHSARENIDASTPSGRLQRNLLASIAQHELEERREGFERARKGAVEAGVWQRHQTPRGYRKDPETRHLVPDEDAALVVRAFEAHARGVPVVQVADMLDMTSSGTRALLSNRVYLGEMKVGEHVNPRSHEPIVDRALFEDVQATRVTRPPRTFKDVALLGGLVRCEACGFVMSRAKTKRVIYTCPGRHSNGRCPAPAGITAGRLDEHVTQIMVSALHRLRLDPASDGAEYAAAVAAERGADAELRAFLVGVQAAGLAPEDFAGGARERRERRDAARIIREDVERRGRVVSAGDPVAVWEEADVGRRNHLLRGLVEAVIVRSVGRGGRVVPTADRVRVIAAGAGLVTAGPRGGVAHDLRRLTFPEADDPRVLRV